MGDKVELNSGIDKGDNTISVSDPSGFSSGDWIHYFEYLFPVKEVNDWPKSIGQITKVESINYGTSTITLQREASKNYSTSYGPYIEKINPVMNIGLEKLKIKRMDGSKSNDGSNGSNIIFSRAVNCWIKGVEFEQTSKHHIVVNFSSNLEMSGCYFNDARDHGDGGYGYGVALQRSTNYCLIENNIFYHLRHSMLVQSGANSNTFELNYSRKAYATYGVFPYGPPDICLHGRYPFANMFEQNNVELIAADDSHENESSGINNGPYNAFVRNVVYDDPAYEWRIISLKGAPHSSVLGNYIYWPDQCPLQKSDGTSIDRDIHGIAVSENPPNDTYETGYVIEHCTLWLSSYYNWNNTFLNDISYYYSNEPTFLDVSYTNYTWPACGPALYPERIALTQSIPARGRYSHSVPKTYINDHTKWPPEPLAVSISGPSFLASGETGTFTANPSGGSGDYTNYRWWERNDEGGITPYSKDNTILAPPQNYWIEQYGWEGQQSVQVARTYDFSLKCEVTDSDGNTAIDIHSVNVGGLQKAGGDMAKVSQPVPETVELTGNYPNPFNPATTIKFGLPQEAQVKLSIFSITG
ncbi:MAG: hypothetical protein GF313_15460 [Caldithrix sp.]|nr:hypothetical protein [Caldithrix sp.]